MSEPEYRRAKSAILHDANLMIVESDQNGYTEVPFCYTDYSIDGFAIDGWEVGRFLQALGIEANPIKVRPDVMEVLDDQTFRIQRKMNVYGESFANGRVGSVYVRMDAPQTISIRVTELWEGDDGEEEINNEITYCGRFTIEWGEPKRETKRVARFLPSA